MPDISMCANWACPLTETCYRFRAKPDPHRQSYADFKFKMNGENEAKCDYYWQVEGEGEHLTDYLETMKKFTDGGHHKPIAARRS